MYLKRPNILKKALPQRKAESFAATQANSMLTGGGKSPLPHKSPNSKGGIFCPACGEHHGPGQLCGNKSLQKLIDLIKGGKGSGIKGHTTLRSITPSEIVPEEPKGFDKFLSDKKSKESATLQGSKHPPTLQGSSPPEMEKPDTGDLHPPKMPKAPAGDLDEFGTEGAKQYGNSTLASTSHPSEESIKTPYESPEKSDISSRAGRIAEERSKFDLGNKHQLLGTHSASEKEHALADASLEPIVGPYSPSKEKGPGIGPKLSNKDKNAKNAEIAQRNSNAENGVPPNSLEPDRTPEINRNNNAEQELRDSGKNPDKARVLEDTPASKQAKLSAAEHAQQLIAQGVAPEEAARQGRAKGLENLHSAVQRQINPNDVGHEQFETRQFSPNAVTNPNMVTPVNPTGPTAPIRLSPIQSAPHNMLAGNDMSGTPSMRSGEQIAPSQDPQAIPIPTTGTPPMHSNPFTPSGVPASMSPIQAPESFNPNNPNVAQGTMPGVSAPITTTGGKGSAGGTAGPIPFSQWYGAGSSMGSGLGTSGGTVAPTAGFAAQKFHSFLNPSMNTAAMPSVAGNQKSPNDTGGKQGPPVRKSLFYLDKLIKAIK